MLLSAIFKTFDWRACGKASRPLLLMAAALLASAGLAVAPAEAASTGTWTPTANGGTAVAGGVTVTVNGVGTGGTAPTASTLNTGNTASFWTNPYSGGTPTQATPALSFVLAPQGTTLTATFTFSKAVDNPVIHFARLGGAVGTVSNTSVWALSGSTSTGGSVTTSLLAGSNTQFQYTSSNFQRTPNAVTAATNPGICVAGDATHMACGSIQFNGTGITQLTFTITWAGATGGIGDGIDVALSIPDTKVVINKQTAGGTNTFSFTGTNGVANASLNTATSNPIERRSDT